jgi:hypothetical protein
MNMWQEFSNFNYFVQNSWYAIEGQLDAGLTIAAGSDARHSRLIRSKFVMTITNHHNF